MEKKMHLVDVNTLNWGRCPGPTKQTKEWLEEATAVEATPVVHGHWNGINQHKDVEGYIYCDFACSVCGEIVEEEHNYCPYCGAKMDSATVYEPFD